MSTHPHAFTVVVTAAGFHRLTCRCGRLDVRVHPNEVARVKQRHLAGEQ